MGNLQTIIAKLSLSDHVYSSIAILLKVKKWFQNEYPLTIITRRYRRFIYLPTHRGHVFFKFSAVRTKVHPFMLTDLKWLPLLFWSPRYMQYVLNQCLDIQVMDS